MKVLVVDDDNDIRNLVKLYLENDSYEVLEAGNGLHCLEILESDTNNAIDLVLLDCMMPKMDGIETCFEIRKKYNLPIIFLTAKSEDIDKFTGFSSGADDYITKPFNPIDLVARIKSNIRRYRQYSQSPSYVSVTDTNKDIINYNDLVMNLVARSLTKKGVPIKLTKIEFSILELFLKNQKRVYSLEQIYANVWGEFNILNTESTVSVHIRNLRNKIEDDTSNPEYIKTVWGVGYRVD